RGARDRPDPRRLREVPLRPDDLTVRDLGGRDAMGGDLVLLVGCLLVGLLAFALPSAWSGAVVSSLRATALAPVVALRALAARDSLALRLQRDSTLLAENAGLRGLLGLAPRLETSWTPAEVLHTPSPTDPRAILLSAGSRAGVAINQPVLTADGLLGVTWTVGPDASTATTWQHPEFRVSATTRGGTVLGIVGPVIVGASGEPLLELRG